MDVEIMIARSGNPFSNTREGPSPLQGNGETDLDFSFSQKVTTPQIAFYATSGQFFRYNTATDAQADNDDFPSPPLGFGRPSWMTVTSDDDIFGVQKFLNQAPIVYWRASDNTILCSIDPRPSGFDEQRLLKGGVYAFLSNQPDATVNEDRLTLSTCAIDNPTANISSHGDTTETYLVTTDPTTGGGFQTYVYNPTTNTRTNLGSPGDLTDSSGHNSAQWTVDNLVEWYIFSGYGSTRTTGRVSLAIIFIRPDDTNANLVRLLCHTDGTGGGYQTGGQAHANLSADGWLVSWSSNMNGSARSDVFIALVPRS